MKKPFALVLAIVMVSTAFCACEKDTPTGTDPLNIPGTESSVITGTTGNVQEDTASTGVPQDAQMTDPYDGTILSVDTTWNGVIEENAEPVSSSKVIINGTTYEFPFAAGQLLENGWSLAPNVSFENDFAANTQTHLIGASLFYEERDYLSIGAVYNNSTAPQPLEACQVTRLTIHIGYRLKLEKTFSFVLPGGITWDSSAADVIAVFGPVENNTNFEYVRVSDDQLSYLNRSGMQYYFSFSDDGSLYQISIEWLSA